MQILGIDIILNKCNSFLCKRINSLLLNYLTFTHLQCEGHQDSGHAQTFIYNCYYYLNLTQGFRGVAKQTVVKV